MHVRIADGVVPEALTASGLVTRVGKLVHPVTLVGALGTEKAASVLAIVPPSTSSLALMSPRHLARPASRRLASNRAMHLAAPGLKPISRLKLIVVMDYSPASTKEEPVHQSMNLLKFPVGE